MTITIKLVVKDPASKDWAAVIEHEEFDYSTLSYPTNRLKEVLIYTSTTTEDKLKEEIIAKLKNRHARQPESQRFSCRETHFYID